MQVSYSNQSDIKDNETKSNSIKDENGAYKNKEKAIRDETKEDKYEYKSDRNQPEIFKSNKNIENKSKANNKENIPKNSAKKKFCRKININTASIAELSENLKGIGPSKAKLIVIYRKSRGDFSSIDEIKNIKGIGDKIFDEIKDRITV